jgi:hypothetical protein
MKSSKMTSQMNQTKYEEEKVNLPLISVEPLGLNKVKTRHFTREESKQRIDLS